MRIQNTFQVPDDCLSCQTIWREYNDAVYAAEEAHSNVGAITAATDWGEQAELQELLIAADSRREHQWTAIRSHENATHRGYDEVTRGTSIATAGSSSME